MAIVMFSGRPYLCVHWLCVYTGSVCMGEQLPGCGFIHSWIRPHTWIELQMLTNRGLHLLLMPVLALRLSLNAVHFPIEYGSQGNAVCGVHCCKALPH